VPRTIGASPLRTPAACRSATCATSTGNQLQATNVRRRILAPATKRANELIAELGDDVEPLPTVTPHSLRRTFASWLVAEGEDAAYVMSQLGHTDPKITLGLYAKALKSKRRRPHARRKDRVDEATALCTSAQSHDLEPPNAAEVLSSESRIPAGDSEKWS
jgi:hypothetical protein